MHSQAEYFTFVENNSTGEWWTWCWMYFQQKYDEHDDQNDCGNNDAKSHLL